MTTYILEDDEGTVDAADGVVANPGDDRVRRRHARVRHVGLLMGGAGGRRGGRREEDGGLGSRSGSLEMKLGEDA